MSNSITSANSIFILTVPELAIVGHRLQGFSAESAFITEKKTYAETVMGVDGKMSAGYTPTKSSMSIKLQADSESRDVLDIILEAMETSMGIYYISGTISLPAISKSYTLTKGVLVSGQKLPDAKKLLDPTDYSIDWQSIRSSSF